MRAVHLVALAGFAAAVLGTGPYGWIWGIVLIVSGIVMMALDAWAEPGYFRQVDGLGVVLKLVLVGVMLAWPAGRMPLFWLIVFGSAMLSHAPGRVRHWRLF